jgi:hypothetical protein
MGRIKELEREVMVMRGKHSDAIQQLKTRFLTEKRDYQLDSENKINSMAKQANKVKLTLSSMSKCASDHFLRLNRDHLFMDTCL